MNVSVSIGGYVLLTNVGAAYDSTGPARGLGSSLIDFFGVSSIDFRVGVNKIGSGTQSWQLWNLTDGAEIAVINDAGATGAKILNLTINPPDIPSGVKLVRVRAKSTTAADDPEYYGSTLLLSRPAPDFSRAGLIVQLIREVWGLIRDMRRNAQSYKDQLLPPYNRTPAQVAAVMVGDANAYLARTSRLTAMFQANPGPAADALADAGLTVAQATALRDTVNTVANHTLAASLTTANEINTEADFILATVPVYPYLW